MIPVHPPREWFNDPQLQDVTALRVLPSGRVFGHFAQWGQCHIGIVGECVPAPHSTCDYAWFATGEVLTAEGEYVRVGKLVMGGGHADLQLDYKATVAAYDNTCSVFADVAVGEDHIGPWIAGALRPTVDDFTLRQVRNTELSGDWRPYGNGRRELTAILAVNSGGFKVPRVAVAASGRALGSVGLGMVRRDGERGALVASVLRADLIARTLG